MLLTYFILMLDKISFASTILTIVSMTIGGIACGSYFIDGDKSYKPLIKPSLITLTISAMLLIFTPTTKQAALIFLSGQEDVVSTAKNLPKLTKFGTDYLIELLEEGKKDGGKH